MAITKEKIWAAADALDGEGRSPTLAAVRKAVGGGSYTTIQEAMVEWKARRAAREAPAMVPPEAVSDLLTRLGQDLWGAAMASANARLAAERAALEEDRLGLETACREATELADQLNADLERSRDRVSALEAEEKTAREETGRLRQRLASSETRVTDLERQAAEAGTARQAAAEARERAAEMAGRLQVLTEQNAALLAQLTASGDQQPKNPLDQSPQDR